MSRILKKEFGKISKSIYRAYIRILSIKRPQKNIGNNTITIIKYDGIGDFILFLDAAKGLRKLYQDKKIIFTCPLSVKELAEQSGYFDEVVVFRKAELGFGNALKAKKKARKLACECLIHVSFSRDYTSEVLAAFIPSDNKISVPYTCVFDEKTLKWTHSIYDRFLDIPLDMMCIQQNKLILNEMGYSDFKSSYPVLKVVPFEHLCLPPRYYVLFVGGSSVLKRWNEDNYVELIRYIKTIYNAECVLAGDNNDIEQGNFIARQVECYSYIGKTDLKELIYLISKSSFVLGNDTSAIHIAASLGVASLCVSSAASAKRFYPYVVDKKSNGGEPMFVKMKVPCEGCSFSEKTFLKCMENRRGKRKRCVEEIPFEEVKKQVDCLINKLKN